MKRRTHKRSAIVLWILANAPGVTLPAGFHNDTPLLRDVLSKFVGKPNTEATRKAIKAALIP